MDISHSLPTSPKLVESPPRYQSTSTERPIDAITRKLWEIGAIPLEDFLAESSTGLPRRAPTTSLQCDTKPILSPVGRDSSARAPGSLEGDDEALESIPPAVAPLSERNLNGDPTSNFPLTRDNAITRLHQACIRVSGSADSLRYEFMEENGQKSGSSN